MFCVNPWKMFYINTSVPEDGDYESGNRRVSEDGAYDGSGGRGEVSAQT